MPKGPHPMSLKLTEDNRPYLTRSYNLLVKWIRDAGYEPRDVHAAYGKPEHWRVWQQDALADACRMLLDGEDIASVLRTLLLAREYCGRLGFWGSSVVSDLYSYIEALLIKRVRGERGLVVRD